MSSSFRDFFPSKYYKAPDLEDGPLDVTIKTFFSEAVQEGEPPKPCVSFEEPGKKILVVNVTRGESISGLASTEDPTRWPGARVRLQLGYTRYQGKRTACIDVVAPSTDKEAVGF